MQGFEREDTNGNRVALIFGICIGTLIVLGSIIFTVHFFLTSKTTLDSKPHEKLFEYVLSHSINTEDNLNTIFLTSYKNEVDRFEYTFRDGISNACDRDWYSDYCGIEIYIDDKRIKEVYGEAEYKRKHWGDRISGGKPWDISPNFSVDIPISKDYLYKYLTIEVFMRVYYPYQGGNFISRGFGFSNRDVMLKSSFKLFVVSPDEIDYKYYFDNKLSTPIGAFVVMLFGLGVLFFSIRSYRRIFW